MHRIFELVGIGVFGGYAILVTGRLIGVVETAMNGWVLGCAAIIGYCLADLISGLVHWFADTYFGEDTPFVGPNFVGPFRFHHVDPKDITKHDFVEVNGNNCIVSFWVLMWAYHGRSVAAGDNADVFVLGLALFSMLGIFATNQFHKWAHADTVPKSVAWLQRRHLILAPAHHAIHHGKPHDDYYCITVGWLNWTLKRIRFFRILEWVCSRGFRLRVTAPDRVVVVDGCGANAG